MVGAEATIIRSRKVSLRRCIQSVISESPDRASTAYVIEQSHKLALAYLIKKMHSGSLQLSMFGLSVEDLALDSIAELFQRNEDGTFPTLRAYFERYLDISVAGDTETTVALRRLVFSKVNENLFRRYHEADANLSRIIRNVKDGTKVNDDLVIQSVRGQMSIVVKEEARTERHRKPDAMNLPLAPPEVLESFFTSELGTHRRVRDLTARYVDFTRAHPFYAPGHPLISFARFVRAAFERTEAASCTDEAEQLFSKEETEQAVAYAVKRVAVDKKASYVGRGKIDVATFEAYLEAVSTILTIHFIHDVETVSFYAVLSEHLPDLSESDYKENHRNILEYLTKLARTELLALLTESV